MYDPETAGYLAKSAFMGAMKTIGVGAGIGAGTGAVAGAMNGDGKTGLGTRVLRGAVGGAVGGAAVGAMPFAWNKGQAAISKFRNLPAPPPSGMTHIEHKLIGGIGGVIGGVANTGGDNSQW